MDVFLTVRRKKLTLFLDAKENTSVLQLKQVIQGITRRKAEDMKLLRIGSNEPLDDKKSLVECGYDSQSCRAQDPQTIGLVFRVDDSEEFEELDVEAYSSPPELPDVMKEHQDPSGVGHEGM